VDAPLVSRVKVILSLVTCVLLHVDQRPQTSSSGGCQHGICSDGAPDGYYSGGAAYDGYADGAPMAGSPQ